MNYAIEFYEIESCYLWLFIS